MKTPRLVQRCVLKNEKLVYEYMGSAEFEFGAPADALKRIFEKGIVLWSTNITVSDKNIPVYMVAGDGFAFSDYQPYLQQLSENALRLKEESHFDEILKVKLGMATGRSYVLETNVWFDIQNDVLWVLSQEDHINLVAVLSDIQKTWAKKK